MPAPLSYCDFVKGLAPGEAPEHRRYHDRHYGFPVRTDNALFERLVLEINQAGLSWTTILRKQAGFRRAYHRFDIARVARYGPRDVRRLLSDAGIIRNRLKIQAAIHNARVILDLKKCHGSFGRWLESQGRLALPDWVALFKRTFRFTGGEIVREFLVSIGRLPGAHDSACPIYREILQARPARRG